MSRSGYSDDCENLELYRQAVSLAIRGKRGQKLLREMAAAMDAMPEKRLVTGKLVGEGGEACALGTVALARGHSPEYLATLVDDEDWDNDVLAEMLDVARALVQEVEYENDECGDNYNCVAELAGEGALFGARVRYVGETPEQRWTRMRAWVAAHLRQDAPATGER